MHDGCACIDFLTDSEVVRAALGVLSRRVPVNCTFARNIMCAELDRHGQPLLCDRTRQRDYS